MKTKNLFRPHCEDGKEGNNMIELTKIKNENILSLARSMADSTPNIYCRAEITNLIDEIQDKPQSCTVETLLETVDNENMLLVLARICADEYDISDQGFFLWEIPLPCIYIFTDGKEKWFDVYLNGADPEVISLEIQYFDGACNYTVDTIEEAIEKYE